MQFINSLPKAVFLFSDNIFLCKRGLFSHVILSTLYQFLKVVLHLLYKVIENANIILLRPFHHFALSDLKKSYEKNVLIVFSLGI